MFKKPLFKETVFVFFIMLVMHLLALKFYLYWTVGEYDSVLHFLGGLWTSLLFLWLYFFSGVFAPKSRTLFSFFVVSTLSLVLVGVAWEIFELLTGLTFVQWSDYFSDTALDFVMDFFGSVVGFLYAYIREIENQNIPPETNGFSSLGDN